MSTAAKVLREREEELNQEISSSINKFDMGAPLTEAELEYAGMTGVLPALQPKPILQASEMPLLREIEDAEEPVISVDAVEALSDRYGYNAQYVHYMKCQAIVALAGFAEGWEAFEELALKTFVRNAKRDDEEYRGDDPHKAFSLRVKRQSAEDFFKFIRRVVNEAAATGKPVLAAK
jgi:hypothetical protein